MMQSEEIGELAKALSEAQPHIKKPETNGVANYGKYSTLSDLRNAILPALNAKGIAVTQLIMSEGAEDFVETKLIHASGQWLGCRMKLRLDKPTMQGYGSAVTYGCRYTLNAIAGHGEGEEDDDGKGAETDDETPSGPQSDLPLSKKESKGSQIFIDHLQRADLAQAASYGKIDLGRFLKDRGHKGLWEIQQKDFQKLKDELLLTVASKRKDVPL